MYIRKWGQILTYLFPTAPICSNGPVYHIPTTMSLIELICILGRPTKYATQENDELRLPLQNGWKREINVREYSKSGIRGDVVYFAPCGKKFKQYPDIIRVSVQLEFIFNID